MTIRYNKRRIVIFDSKIKRLRRKRKRFYAYAKKALVPSRAGSL